MTTHTFLGRTEELRTLGQMLAESQGGNPRLLFLSGSAGVGKSTLVHQALQEAPCRRVESRAYQEATPAFSPLVDLLRLLLTDLDTDQLNLQAFLSPLLPELGEAPPDYNRTNLAAAVREVLQQATRQQPLVWLFEDIHWADDATLELLPHLLPPGQPLPFLLIATYRSEEDTLATRLRSLRAELRRQRYFREMHLSPFDEPFTRQLMEKHLGSKVHPHLARAVFQQTRGLPLFVEEISRTLAEQQLLQPASDGYLLDESKRLPLPDSIRDAVARQLDRLSPAAREKLELAASIGKDFDLEMLLHITGSETGVDELLRLQLIREEKPGRASFRHELVREAVRNEILWSRRRQLQRRIAEALEERQASPELTAEFWMQAGEQQRARKAYLRAALSYCRLHAHRDATRSARHALELWPAGREENERLETLEQLAECAQLSGQIQDAVMTLRELIASPLLRDQPARIAEHCRALATAYSLQGAWRQYKDSRKQAAEAFESAGKWEEAAREQLALANRLGLEFELAAAIHVTDRAAACARRAGKEDLRASALALKGYAMAIQGKGQESLAVAHEAIEIALAGNHLEAAAEAYRRLAGALEYTSEFNASIRAYETALHFCVTNGVDLQARHCLPCMAWVLFRLGDWKKAMEVCREVINHKNPFDAAICTAHTVLALIHAHRGELKTAIRHQTESQRLANREQIAYSYLILPWCKALIKEQEGDEAGAHQQYLEMIDNWYRSEDRHDILPGLTAAAAFFAGRRQEEGLGACIQVFSKIAAETANPEPIACLGYALGEAALLNQRHEEALQNFERAAHQFTELSAPLEHSYVLRRLGDCLLATGAEDAPEKYEAAAAIAKRLGIRPLAALLEAKLKNPGKHISTPHTAAVTESLSGKRLTRRQLEILPLLAEGLSNKEIAARLHLSTRTVDMHVSNILDRFNCRTRTEAVRIAAEENLLGS